MRLAWSVDETPIGRSQLRSCTYYEIPFDILITGTQNFLCLSVKKTHQTRLLWHADLT